MAATSFDEILTRLQKLQAELEAEIDALLREKREEFSYTLEQGKVRFEQGIKAWQRRRKTGLLQYLLNAKLAHVLTAPVAYSLVVPFVLLDITASLYQQVCFRVYAIPRVVRNDYIVIDRQHLAYLNIIEKFNCVYCGYGNGLLAYVREIAARTEQYWCPIKHTRRSADPHRLELKFVDYGDADSYQAQLKLLRSEIASLKQKENVNE